jgi:hypothetical protein
MVQFQAVNSGHKCSHYSGALRSDETCCIADVELVQNLILTFSQGRLIQPSDSPYT